VTNALKLLVVEDQKDLKTTAGCQTDKEGTVSFPADLRRQQIVE
jgi:hypothetical protein